MRVSPSGLCQWKDCVMQESAQAPRQQAARKLAASAELSPWAPQAEQGEDVCISSGVLQLPSVRYRQGLYTVLGQLPDIAL